MKNEDLLEHLQNEYPFIIDPIFDLLDDVTNLTKDQKLKHLYKICKALNEQFDLE